MDIPAVLQNLQTAQTATATKTLDPTSNVAPVTPSKHFTAHQLAAPTTGSPAISPMRAMFTKALETSSRQDFAAKVSTWANEQQVEKVLSQFPDLLESSITGADGNPDLSKVMSLVKNKFTTTNWEELKKQGLHGILEGSAGSAFDLSKLSISPQIASSVTPLALNTLVETGTRALDKFGISPESLQSPEAMLTRFKEIMSNDEMRSQLLSQIKEWCVDFLMEFVPSMRVPVITGQTDTIRYVIDNVTLSEFRLKGNDVNLRATSESMSVDTTNMKFSVIGCHWRFSQKQFPYFSASGVADCGTQSLQLKIELDFLMGTLEKPTPTVSIRSAAVMLGDISVRVRDTLIGPIANVLSTVFSEVVRKNVEKQLNSTLDQRASQLVTALNSKVAQVVTKLSQSPAWTNNIESIRSLNAKVIHVLPQSLQSKRNESQQQNSPAASGESTEHSVASQPQLGSQLQSNTNSSEIVM
eukprot:c37_g1_i1.p1 GENE.c37_g1_i1~~c37_g1_i1.p1  ORF type:complete len:536 (+),score=167.09 c37_g1_i1:200-1609(+)